MEQRIYLISDLVALLRLSRSTVDRRVREARSRKSDFPLPISEQGQRLLWDAQAVEQWLAGRNKSPPQVNVIPAKSDKRKSRDFAERQERAQRALERHGFNRK